MRLFNRYFSAFDLLLLLGDIILTVFATVAARLLMVFTGLSDGANWVEWLTLGSMISFIMLVSFYYADLYALDQTVSERELGLRFVNGFGIACVIVGAVSYPIQEHGSQHIYLIEILFMGVGLLAWRLLFTWMVKSKRIHGRVAIVGTQRIGKVVAEELYRQKQLGMAVVGFIGAEPGNITLTYGNPVRVTLPVFPRCSTLGTIEAHGVNRILIADSDANLPAQDLLHLRLKGIPIEDCHTFYERLKSKIAIADLQPAWIVLSKGFRRSRLIVFCKRLIDVLVSAVGLILSLPVSLITAILIKWESAGPVLYCQERIGQNERPFILYKFRSMFDNAEVETGPVWAAEKDPRITRVGRVIRKLRIDEIPQMINVLKGEMSFVGPRPERPFFVSTLKPKIRYYDLRFTVKPGITGWAQVSYPYGDSEEDAIEKLEYDLYYIKHVSLIFDLQIIFETFKVILCGRGAQ
jgi:sugar transferase (PEP-CTERM system associated)